MRQNAQELELDTDGRTIRKLVLVSAACVTLLSAGIGGVFYLTHRTGERSATENVNESASPQAWIFSFISGGRVKPREYDRALEGVCKGMASAHRNIMLSIGESPKGDVDCKDMIPRTQQDMSRVFKDVEERMRRFR